MVILAMDPSFNALSTSILNTDTHKIYVHTISHPLGEGIGFDKIFTASRELREWQSEYIDGLLSDGSIPEITEVFSEVAPPVSQFSSGLYALDTLILSNLFDRYKTVKKVYAIPPSYCSTIHGTNKYSKSESTKLAKYFIEEVLNETYEIVIPDSVSDKGRVTKGRMNNDKAESFLFLLRAIVKYDIDGLAVKLSSIMGGFLHETEKLIAERQ